jgi:hypothetical protein
VLGVVEHGPAHAAEIARAIGLTRQSVQEVANGLGFFIEGEDRVDDINQRLREDGFDVAPPTRSHAYGFYVEAPGGFTVELGA